MPQPLSDIGERIDLLKMTLGLFAPEEPLPIAGELVELGEETFEHWLIARGETTAADTPPGARLLALQGAAVLGEPAFTDMADKCQQLLRLRDLVVADPKHAETLDRLILATEILGDIYSVVSRRMMGLDGPVK
jgi:hypothetical protein